ncbi:MAG: HAMP domain-containing histidine kinase [bacterium]|nr:HAMP domain-containing histidine kinase [bacterium]
MSRVAPSPDAVSPRAPLPARAEVSPPWLARLRWGTVGGQVLTVLVGRLAMGAELSMRGVLTLLAVTVATNLALVHAVRNGRPVGPAVCGALLVLDTLVLTALLQLTGGPYNPFSVLYLVQITLAAVVLGARWTTGLAVLSVASYAALFLISTPDVHAMHGHGGAFSVHLQGMLVAFIVAAALIATFVVRLSAAIEARDHEIAAMREQAVRTERLAALTTLAAGAAHELGTPLGTIAIVATELQRALERVPDVDGAMLREDARLIRAEVERCRAILDQLATDAGEVTGEAPVRVSVDELVRDVLGQLPAAATGRVSVDGLPLARAASVPRRALVGAITSLLRNALDATAAGGDVRLEVGLASGDGPAARDDRLRVVVRDGGVGMPPDVLARASEPFFTTKPAGRGMGLGLFLARTLVEGLGGRLALDSMPGRGTTATLDLPLAGATAGGSHGA